MKTTKIQPEKIRYTINEAERTVTAEATNLSLLIFMRRGVSGKLIT